MRLRTVPARQGFAWVRRGFRAFLQRPLANTVLLGSFMLAAFALLLLPVVGVVLVVMALPLVSLGFMIATRRALAGLPAGPGVLLEGLRAPMPRRRSMLTLLAVYAAANLLVMLLADAVDGGRFAALQQALTAESAPSPEQMAELLGDPRLFWGLVLRFGLTALVSLPFWHAPALVHWEGQGVGQALFISSLACWRNKGALVVYGAGWLALVLLFSMLANTVVALFGEPRLLALAAMPAALMFSTAFYASLYFIYADCFQPDPPVPALVPEPADAPLPPTPPSP
ncbi:BPSS1780 family membrane protein [Piscinibacter sakaiensis]|uniref:FIGfam005179 protein n=1 Tax=Piscinibacter sakaiensis TaxID=1547922 RepID=A0A0K8P8C4_PISS1|nr:BPSS1780 family membrane protein [Piscinibacter sakaiensis]GAP38445.1 FIGfam005179 protein [Piscinibacter sakaiensis]